MLHILTIYENVAHTIKVTQFEYIANFYISVLAYTLWMQCKKIKDVPKILF